MKSTCRRACGPAPPAKHPLVALRGDALRGPLTTICGTSSSRNTCAAAGSPVLTLPMASDTWSRVAKRRATTAASSGLPASSPITISICRPSAAGGFLRLPPSRPIRDLALRRRVSDIGPGTDLDRLRDCAQTRRGRAPRAGRRRKPTSVHGHDFSMKRHSPEQATISEHRCWRKLRPLDASAFAQSPCDVFFSAKIAPHARIGRSCARCGHGDLPVSAT